MATNDSIYAFPAEHEGFLAEFQALLEKHPCAAGRFAPADVSSDAGNQLILRGRFPDLECVATEWGIICKAISPLV